MAARVRTARAPMAMPVPMPTTVRLGGAGRRATVCAAAGGASPLTAENVGPTKGSTHRRKRVARGYSAGQGNTGGRGRGGDKVRKGPGPASGFEGGQMPLYRRLPKLKGIAGGMSAGVQRFAQVNVSMVAAAGVEVVDIDVLQATGVMTRQSGAVGKLPLKVLGDGEISSKVKVTAAGFSASARAKIEAAGGECIVVKKTKWMRDRSVKKSELLRQKYGDKDPKAKAKA